MTLSVSQVDFFVMFIRYRKMTEENIEFKNIKSQDTIMVEISCEGKESIITTFDVISKYVQSVHNKNIMLLDISRKTGFPVD